MQRTGQCEPWSRETDFVVGRVEASFDYVRDDTRGFAQDALAVRLAEGDEADRGIDLALAPAERPGRSRPAQGDLPANCGQAEGCSARALGVIDPGLGVRDTQMEIERR